MAPLSTRIDLKQEVDLEIYPDQSNNIKQPSLVRLGPIQPMLKSDLDEYVGRLAEADLVRLSALLAYLAGIKS